MRDGKRRLLNTNYAILRPRYLYLFYFSVERSVT